MASIIPGGLSATGKRRQCNGDLNLLGLPFASKMYYLLRLPNKKEEIHFLEMIGKRSECVNYK